ncbi:MAG: zinc ribbon domain-containing protein [Deltaproteobacteria bacterium]|nr:zinc ribbon domain-containing protein [Deltaproteobacteria bacterium]RLB91550.1 MAG: zinc ribbon domain-containing protein [Deltaproteobacteria bacterium]RLB96025.1 MAG: zinc ribbon domain-containing protein [Deltaproteobacteria bacterium]RLC10223.1 MAG: zinc ribbon domain-containing protein [Deltaproteobacteria bacterium]
MPLYEFRCSKCGHEFEEIVFLTDKEPIKCPKCGASNPERLLSMFSSSSSSSDTPSYTASSCSTSHGGFS